MENTRKGKWDQIRERIVSTPELQEQYDHTKRTVALTRRLLMQIDTEREQAGLSKAELARRIGTSPSVVRRIFSSKTGNPTMRTMLDMLDVLGIDLQLKPTKRPGRATAVSGKRMDETRRRVAL